MTDKQQETLDLSAEQQRVAEALVFSGVGYERERLTRIFAPHRGKAINIDALIDIINNVPPQQEDEQLSEESGE